MAAGKRPGPHCSYCNPQELDDGTMCRVPSPSPAPVGAISTDSGFSGSHYSFLDSAECLVVARGLAIVYMPGAVLEETGYQLDAVLKGLWPGLLQMMVGLAASTLIGAGIGGIVGFFAGGVGAAPGALVGGELGFDAGMAILTWIGVAFLLESIASSFGEMTEILWHGVARAWKAGEVRGVRRQREVDRAAHEMARANSILVRLLLQGIVAYLLKGAAVASTRAVVVRGIAVRSVGTEVVADEAISSLVARLRLSQLGDSFAIWVERNWNDLVKNPLLRPRPKLGSGGAVASESEAITQGSKPGRGKVAEEPRSFLMSRKPGVLEPGAVQGEVPVLDVKPPTQPVDPRFQIPAENVDTFGATPILEKLPPGTKIYRIVGRESDLTGEYWSLDPPPASEARWRTDSAVKNDWNGDGGYVEYEVGAEGMMVWKGPAAPQPSSAEGYVLTGGGEQLYVPPGQIGPGPLTPTPTPWNR